jgi:hypothetical protein
LGNDDSQRAVQEDAKRQSSERALREFPKREGNQSTLCSKRQSQSSASAISEFSSGQSRACQGARPIQVKASGKAAFRARDLIRTRRACFALRIGNERPLIFEGLRSFQSVCGQTQYPLPNVRPVSKVRHSQVFCGQFPQPFSLRHGEQSRRRPNPPGPARLGRSQRDHATAVADQEARAPHPRGCRLDMRPAYGRSSGSLRPKPHPRG